jgi:para-nitrobenzyl esterase
LAANTFGVQSLQRATPLATMFGGVQEEVALGEDCLTLNVWTRGCDDAARPVMVWIHGGAFIIGSGASPMYDGAAFAKRDVVLVSINYRLGALGFLRLTDLTNGAIPSTGNEGLLDQIAALRWVRDNIAAFGGDPDNVTIFGESAGGISVGSLMGIDSAAPLFHKAIPQSGACHTASSIETSNLVATMTLEKLGIAADDTAALMNADATDILSAQEAVLAEQGDLRTQRVQGMAYQPVIEPQHMPTLPIDAVRAGSTTGKPLLVGNTLEEMKLFGAMGTAPPDDAQLRDALGKAFVEDDRERLISAYRASLEARGKPADASDISAAISTDRMFRIRGIRLAEAQLEHCDDVYVYLFDWETSFFNLGSCHALELAFVFGTHHLPILEPFFDGAKPGADDLSAAMTTAWCQFAATGNPGGEQPAPSYAQNRTTLVFGADSRIEEDPYPAERQLWDQLEDKIGQM